MTPAVTLKTPCPKCGYHANDATWRGPKYLPGMDVGTSDRQGLRHGETLEFTCEGCGFKTRLPCKDAKP